MIKVLLDFFQKIAGFGTESQGLEVLKKGADKSTPVIFRIINYIRPGSTFTKQLAISTSTRPVRPAIKPGSVQPLSVSWNEKSANLLITQKPESFGSERPTEPKQIARPTSTGEAPIDAMEGATIADVVTRATVAEP